MSTSHQDGRQFIGMTPSKVIAPLEVDMEGGAFARRIGFDDRALARLLIARMARLDYIGLDTSTIRYNPRVRRLLAATPRLFGLRRILRPLVSRSVFYAGHRMHPFSRPERMRFAKGLALTSGALAILATTADDATRAEIMEEAARIRSLLEELRLGGTWTWAHQYPYHIEGTEVTPSTPNLVTTAFVADHYWKWWRFTGCSTAKDRFLDVVKDAVRVFPYVEHPYGICYMYTPVTNLHVHNANLLMAELMARALSLDSSVVDADLVRRAVAYSADHYRSAGGAPYAGPPTVILRADNYHTGYVLRSLAEIMGLMPDLAAELQLAPDISGLLAFYLDRYVSDVICRDESGMMESHSTAESILIYKHFARTLPEDTRSRFHRAIERTIELLWDGRGGFFINCIHRLPGGFHLRDRTDLIRWSQAWMAYALAAPFAPPSRT